ncbi:MAG: serine hydrolase [Pirellulaceae bacterium]|nr:serine hydrolase [Pirellulaceae bacterium]
MIQTFLVVWSIALASIDSPQLPQPNDSPSANTSPSADACAQVAAQADTPVASAAVVRRLREAIDYEVAGKRLPAFSMALVDGDQIIWTYGNASTDPQALNTSKVGQRDAIEINADTIYRAGSVSKLFTDIAIMQLVEAGQLDLDAPVTQYLPQFAPKNSSEKTITLRQLMSHRSGLVREPPVGHYFDPTEPTLGDTVNSLNRTALIYPPDTRTKYSNAGITVAGAVLAAVSGRSYDEQINQAIFRPLKMSSSSFVLQAQNRARLAPYTMWTLEGRRFPAPQFALGTAPAGNLYSTMSDLAAFICCLHAQGKHSTGQLLKPETIEQMFTPGKEADGTPQSFGIGFQIERLAGERKVGHGGAVYGCATQLELLPDHQLGVAASAALDCANGTVERLADFALELMLAQRKSLPLPDYQRTIDVDAARARELVGSYQDDKQNVVEVSYLGGRLTMQRGASRNELRALEQGGELIVDDVLKHGASVKPEGADKLRIDKQLFTRLPDTLPAPPKPHWEGLVGEYGWDHDVLFILEDRGRLVALIEWFFAYPLTEIGPDEYAFPDYGLYHGEQLFFKRDAQGQATLVTAAEVPFVRRGLAGVGETFKIKPVRPLDELRADARLAQPPTERGAFRDSELTELIKLEPRLKLDIRYASKNNFADSIFYSQARAFLQQPAAQAVVRAHKQLEPLGYGLLIHDAYRPWSVTKMFWEATPDSMKDFVANPANGSRHNRGCAVDLSLYDLSTGQPITMVSGYDEFQSRAYPGYPGGTSQQRWHRELLRRTMEQQGFSVYEFEWWHFDYADWKQYRIGNQAFEDM